MTASAAASQPGGLPGRVSAAPSVLSVLVGASSRAGGPPPFVGGSALELARLGLRVRILATDLALAPGGWFQVQRRIQTAELHPTLAGADLRICSTRFPRRLAFSPAFYRAARELMASSSVVHIHNLWLFPQFAAYRAALAANVPYIISPHGGFDEYVRTRGSGRKRVMTALWQREMLDRAALLHVTTEAEKAAIADVAPHVPRVVVPCGLEIAEFARQRPSDAFRRRLDGYGGPVILFLGRITHKKGLDLLIRSFAYVRAVRECRLALVGPDDDGLTGSLERLARDLGVERDVHLLGPLYGDDRLSALAAADAWALSSHAENFGIAVVEAMAAGCPVVMTPAVSLAEEVAEAEAGIVADGTPEAFGRALLAVLANEPLRTRLREAGRAFAARYDWSAVGPRLAEMYCQVASAGHAP